MKKKKLLPYIPIMVLFSVSVLAPLWIVNSESEFDEGSYNQTEFSGSFVQLVGENITGNYTSPIFGAGNQTWDNITWTSNPPNSELPNNQTIETVMGGINMTGNVLLFHFDNRSELEDNLTHLVDFSGSGNNGSVFNGDFSYEEGKLGLAGNFSARASFGVPFNQNINFSITNRMTISTWYKARSNNVFRSIVSNNGLTYNFRLKNTGLRQMFFIEQDGGNVNLECGSHPVNAWEHFVISFNGTHITCYVDGVLIGVKNYDGTFKSSSNNLIVGAKQSPLTQSFNGTIDELAIWNRTLSPDEILNLYKRGVLNLNLTVRSCDDANCDGEDWNTTFDTSAVQNLNQPDNSFFQWWAQFSSEDSAYTPELYNVTIGYSNISQFEALVAAQFKVGNFNFSSDVFVDGFEYNFSLNKPRTILFMNSMNLKKVTGGGENAVSIEIIIDGVVVDEELLGTVKTAGNHKSAGTEPFTFDFLAGKHNVTYDFKRSGNGEIEVDNIDILLVELRTGRGNITGQINNGTLEQTESQFENLFNWSFNKSSPSPTYVSGKFTVTGIASTVTYYFRDLLGNENSSFMRRTTTSATDVGSISGSWIEELPEPSHNFSLQGNHSGAGTIDMNFSIVTFDLLDSQNFTVNSFDSTRTDTDLENSITFGEGLHLILNESLKIESGNGVFISLTSSWGSQSGKQEITVHINSTNLTESVCHSEKERTITSNTDIANVFLYTICTNLTLTNNYTFNFYIEVESGETVELFDEDFNGFEVTKFNLTQVNIGPLPNEIVVPANGTGHLGVVTTSWLVFDDEDGDLVTYNVTILNLDGSLNVSVITSTTDISVDFNFSTLITITNYLFNVEGCDPFDHCVNSTNTFFRRVLIFSDIFQILPNTDIVPYVQLNATRRFEE